MYDVDELGANDNDRLQIHKLLNDQFAKNPRRGYAVKLINFLLTGKVPDGGEAVEAIENHAQDGNASENKTIVTPHSSCAKKNAHKVVVAKRGTEVIAAACVVLVNAKDGRGRAPLPDAPPPQDRVATVVYATTKPEHRRKKVMGRLVFWLIDWCVDDEEGGHAELAVLSGVP